MKLKGQRKTVTNQSKMSADQGKVSGNPMKQKNQRNNRNQRNQKRIGPKIILLMLLVCMVSLLSTGCSKKGSATRVILTTGFEKDEVFRINSVSCRKAELMVYLTNTQNQYENVFGPQIWEKDFQGTTLEENVKETVLARIARIKAMTLLAKREEVTLDENEIAAANEAAKKYFDSLNDREIEVLDVSLDQISWMYQEYALANKVYYYIIKDINPEISDDEARTITVEHILIRTYTLDSAGNRVESTQEAKEETYALACQVWEQIQNGEDFESLMEQYNEDNTNTYYLRHGEADPAFEEAAFSLDTGEISAVVETASGYEIIKCISTFDREQTDVNKIKIVEERRKQVFEEQYEEFVANLTKNLNESLWEEITFIHDEQVTTNSFFDVYNSYFGTE